jgi:cytochrome c biogenesis protein CcmG, thiol:disulfide interchange protein DsbE
MRFASRVLALGLILAATLGSAALASADPADGQAAPALVVTELSGQKFDLARQRGKVVVVNFWATWCPPCRKEMPALDAVFRKYHARGLEIIGLSADRLRRQSDVKNVMASFSYPAAMLAGAEVNGFGRPSELPVTYVIAADGIVRAKLTPDTQPLTEQSLTKLVLPLLPHHPAANQTSAGIRREPSAAGTGS